MLCIHGYVVINWERVPLFLTLAEVRGCKREAIYACIMELLHYIECCKEELQGAASHLEEAEEVACLRLLSRS